MISKELQQEELIKMISEMKDTYLISMLYIFIRELLGKTNTAQVKQSEYLEEKTLIQLRGDKTKGEVAKACDISVSSLTAYENGECIPRDEVKYKLSKYYGITNYNKQIKNAAPTDQSKSCIK